jgi:tetratricopeptide (TPR) repeat protein
MKYKKPEKKLAEIGEDLRAGTILEGSVRKSGNKVRVSVQLVEVMEDKHLWAQSYDRELQDVFGVQSDIAERVAKALEVKVLGNEGRRLEGRGTRNSEALTLYMKGMASYNEGTEPGVRRAFEYYERAIRQDSNFALAYVGLADSYYYLAGEYMSRTEGLAKAREKLDKALALNPDLGEAHGSLGNWLRNELRWEEAAVEFRKGIELSPSDALTHARYAGLLMWTGKLDEALHEARIAHELDPLPPVTGLRIGQVLYYRREYDQAIEQYKQVLRLEPKFNQVLLWMAWAYGAKGMTDEALRLVLKWKEQEGDYPLSPGYAKANVAPFYALAGRMEEAKAMFKEATESDPGLSSAWFAYWHVTIGNFDLAFEYLEKACDARDSELFDIKVDPSWDPLRSDPRFEALLQKLHLS